MFSTSLFQPLHRNAIEARWDLSPFINGQSLELGGSQPWKTDAGRENNALHNIPQFISPACIKYVLNIDLFRRSSVVKNIVLHFLFFSLKYKLSTYLMPNEFWTMYVFMVNSHGHRSFCYLQLCLFLSLLNHCDFLNWRRFLLVCKIIHM